MGRLAFLQSVAASFNTLQSLAGAGLSSNLKVWGRPRHISPLWTQFLQQQVGLKVWARPCHTFPLGCKFLWQKVGQRGRTAAEQHTFKDRSKLSILAPRRHFRTATVQGRCLSPTCRALQNEFVWASTAALQEVVT
eukprot:350143-Chlamydomonas_euryale.AAC.3